MNSVDELNGTIIETMEGETDHTGHYIWMEN